MYYQWDDGMKVALARLVLNNADQANEIAVLKRLLRQSELATGQDLLGLAHWLLTKLNGTEVVVGPDSSSDQVRGPLSAALMKRTAAVADKSNNGELKMHEQLTEAIKTVQIQVENVWRMEHQLDRNLELKVRLNRDAVLAELQGSVIYHRFNSFPCTKSQLFR